MTAVTFEIAFLWDTVERGNVGALTDEKLRALHEFCTEHDIALPPAADVATEMEKRGLL